MIIMMKKTLACECAFPVPHNDLTVKLKLPVLRHDCFTALNLIAMNKCFRKMEFWTVF